jgi:hypothetical protein
LILKELSSLAQQVLTGTCANSGDYTFFKGLFMKSTFAKTAAALAVLAFCAGAAQAAPITVVSDLGTLTNSVTFMTPNQIVNPNTAFAFGYSFTVASPYTSLQASINWTPNDPVAGFTGTLYSVSCTGLNCNTTGTLANFASADSLNWKLPNSGYLSVTPGTYAYWFTGTTSDNGGTTGFSGQTTARVPAPAVLGLVGLGLIGMGLGRKARRA